MRVLRPFAALTSVLALGLGASAAYTVRPGDTLSGIAARLGVRMADLARANGISDPDRVYAGSTLRVPDEAAAPAGAASGATHVVARGENLTVIARRYGTSVRALASINGLDPSGLLLAGARLRIPGAGAPPNYPARLRQVPERLALVPTFHRWADANGVPADLLMAMTWLESGWQNTKTSHVGAIGIGQLMPDTVRFVRTHLIGAPTLDPHVPEDNIRMSARFLRYLLERTGGDVREALAGYYQGLRSVRTKGTYRSTVRYVDGVLALRPRFRG